MQRICWIWYGNLENRVRAFGARIAARLYPQQFYTPDPHGSCGHRTSLCFFFNFSNLSSSQVNTVSIKFKLTDRPASPLLPDDHGINSMSLSLSDMRWHIPLSEWSSIVDSILNGDDKADKHMLKNCEHRIRNIFEIISKLVLKCFRFSLRARIAIWPWLGGKDFRSFQNQFDSKHCGISINDLGMCKSSACALSKFLETGNETMRGPNSQRSCVRWLVRSSVD